MMFKSGGIHLLFLTLLLQASCSTFDNASSQRLLVKNQQQYWRAVEALRPGDTVVLADGIWRDFEILFAGEGSKDAPITLTVENKGKVIIAGESNLRIAGSHLIVEGLVFRDGYTPTDAVIAYRKNARELASYSRITEVVIDNFNNPERTETDHWVTMYGKHNRFDHNHLEGKRNKGVTMAVRLNSEASQQNYHRIDHNYFGPRPILGSNGGETLRIGTSHYSLANSHTTVENNYFDRCDGELEIISNKSAGNVIRGNVFFESRGTLTLRHGRDNIVEDNVFFGNGVDHTGGIRVINADQTIRNNYMEGLAGYRFGGALVVMNGVPNSPINRYHQVENALIENNSIIRSDHVQLAAGSDAERSAVPINSRFDNNLVFHDLDDDVFTVYDDVSGISFNNNVQNNNGAFGMAHGFNNVDVKLQRAENGLLYPLDGSLANVGIAKTLRPVQKAQAGVSWYAKPVAVSRFAGGKQITVSTEQGALAAAVANAQSADTLLLDPGEHIVSRVLSIKQPLTIRSAAVGQKAGIRFERTALFEIQDGGSLALQGLRITGEMAPDMAGNALIRTQRSSMLNNYALMIEDVEVSKLDINHSFHFFEAAKSTFADRIVIRDSAFAGVTGHILKLNSETDDYGIYNAEYVDITETDFRDIQGSLSTFYRGGTDESTFGPHFALNKSRLSNVGGGKRNKSAAVIHLHGVQVTDIRDNSITGSPGIAILHTVGEPVTRIVGNTFIDTAAPSVKELNSDRRNTAFIADNSVAGAAQ